MAAALGQKAVETRGVDLVFGIHCGSRGYVLHGSCHAVANLSLSVGG